MRKIETTNISGSQKAPFVKATFDEYTSNMLDITTTLYRSIADIYATDDVVVLYGAVVTANIPGTSAVTAGAIYYNGEIYQVDANASISSPANTLVWNIVTSYASGDPVDWSDGVPRNLHAIRKFVLTNGASLSGLKDYNAATLYKLRDRIRGIRTDLTPYLVNSYTAFSVTPIARLDLDGNVKMYGGVSAPVAAVNITLMTLPVGLRPTAKRVFIVGNQSGTAGQSAFVLQIDNTGIITMSTVGGAAIPISTTFFLDPVCFNVND